jgi:DNA-binding CsgD family transcriptional regulator
MEREELEGYLTKGLSLEQIGARTGRHPSTVGYWLKKHGLKALNRERFSPRGGLRRDQLEELVEQGLNVSKIAARLDRSTATVKYWLRRYRLQTAAATRRRARKEQQLPKETVQECRAHGKTRFVLEGRGYYRCAKCRGRQVARWRRHAKQRLVDEAGGRCRICGYDRYQGALEFHHLDPASKEFNLSLRGVTRSLETLRAEARKCVLLCANCHAEVEAGVAELSAAVDC